MWSYNNVTHIPIFIPASCGITQKYFHQDFSLQYDPSPQSCVAPSVLWGHSGNFFFVTVVSLTFFALSLMQFLFLYFHFSSVSEVSRDQSSGQLKKWNSRGKMLQRRAPYRESWVWGLPLWICGWETHVQTSPPDAHREQQPQGLENISTRRRRQWHPTPVLLPGKSHGRRSLVGCSPWGR